MVLCSSYQPFMSLLVVFLLGVPPELAGQPVGEPPYEEINQCSQDPIASAEVECVLCQYRDRDETNCCETQDLGVPFNETLTLVMDISDDGTKELDPGEPAVWSCENCDSCAELNADKIFCYFGKTEERVSVYIDNTLKANPCALTNRLTFHIYGEERRLPRFTAHADNDHDVKVDPRVVLEPPIGLR